MNRKAEITWEKAVAFALGALVLFLIVALIVNFLPYAKILSYLGLKIIPDEEEDRMIDRSIREVEKAFEECMKMAGDNCICDVAINLQIPEDMQMEIYEKDGKATVELGDYSSTINSAYCFLEYTPEDLATWYFVKNELLFDESHYISKDLIRIDQSDTQINIHGPMPGTLDLPYRLIKWHGRLCFSPKAELIRYGRRCSALKSCELTVGYVCDASQFCLGPKDYFYTGEGICCAVGCSDTPVQEAPEALLRTADEYYSVPFYTPAVALYKDFVKKYQTHAKAPFAQKRIGDIYMLLGDNLNAIWEWEKLIMMYPRADDLIRQAEQQSDEIINDCGRYFEDTYFGESEEEKAKCNDYRDSLLRGCYYYRGKDDICEVCAKDMPCSTINDKDTCLVSPCRNVGEKTCVWSWGKCRETNIIKKCSDIKTETACVNDPCILGLGNCCYWNDVNKKCYTA